MMCQRPWTVESLSNYACDMCVTNAFYIERPRIADVVSKVGPTALSIVRPSVLPAKKVYAIRTLSEGRQTVVQKLVPKSCKAQKIPDPSIQARSKHD